MPIVILMLHALYVVCVLGLALYGFQALWLSSHYLRRNRHTDSASQPVTNWPKVAIHLPIYNEQHVAERVIRACTRLVYPGSRLRICVLDDSDDSTSKLIDQVVQELCAGGHDVGVIRRSERSGFKAGALAFALQQETADYIAIFDADFVPPEDFLLRTMPRFLDPGNERIGFVQTRWGHLNRENSTLTRCQAVALDGHFVVEQTGRQVAGFAFGFNGSGGVWRRSCIQDPAVGGWQADTLCEDLDLSYRAQLVGWNGIYLNDVESPAEIPPQLLAFKRQQSRWAQGSIQTLRKMGPRVWTSDWAISKRLAATLHLGAYLLHPMLLCLLLITLPLALTDAAPASPLALLSLMSLGPPILYALGQRNLFKHNWLRNFMLLPILMLLGTGLCLNNSIAALKGLFGGTDEFLRTPKFHATAETDKWQGSAYRLPLQPILAAEVFLALYALVTSLVFASRGNYLTMAFIMLYALGFGLVAMLGIWQEWTARSANRQLDTQRRSENRIAQTPLAQSSMAKTKASADLQPAGVTRDS